jgi:pyruvate dehydrogenase E1 component beta subunit
MANKQMNLVEAINNALMLEMQKDKTVIVLGEDVGIDGGVFRVTQGLLEKFGKERVFDTPLAESGIIGTSIGLAINGFKPVAEIQFDGFTFPAFDQLISHAARMRNRSRGRFTIPMVLRFPYSGGIRAPEHHSESPEVLFAHIPGLKVVIPSTPFDAKGLLIASIRDPDPVVFMEPKKVYRAIKQDVPLEHYALPLGQALVAEEGTDVSLISFGAMMKIARQAIELLKKENISIELIDLRTISPLDEKTIIESVEKTGRCVILQEAPRSFGVSSHISAIINENALLSLKAPILRVTGFDVTMPLAKLEEDFLPNEARVIKAVRDVMKY